MDQRILGSGNRENRDCTEKVTTNDLSTYLLRPVASPGLVDRQILVIPLGLEFAEPLLGLIGGCGLMDALQASSYLRAALP